MITCQRVRNEQGASAVEYGLLVALIAGVIVLAVVGLGMVVHGSFSNSCNEFKKPGLSVPSGSCDS